MKKPQTKFDLYKKVLMMWYLAEYENVKAYVYNKSEKLKEKEKLKTKYNELLEMWKEMK